MASKTVIRPNTCCTLGKLSLGEFSPRKGKILAARADKAGENNKAIDPICCNSCIVLPMFFRLVLANSLFSLRDINLTLGLFPPRRHVAWRDSVGVESSRLGLKSKYADIFRQSFRWLLCHTDEPQRGRNSCLWLQSRTVLISFGVVLMSCRVNFHVVRSALQYSACRI